MYRSIWFKQYWKLHFIHTPSPTLLQKNHSNNINAFQQFTKGRGDYRSRKNDDFYRCRVVIFTSQMAIREMVDHDHVTIIITNPSKKPFKLLEVVIFPEMTVLSHKTVISRDFSEKWRFWVTKLLEVMIFP